MRARQFAPRLSLPLVLLCVLFVTLWLAGGASRADAVGQAVVRGIAAAVLIVAALWGRLPSLGHARPVAWLLGAIALLAGLQLVPLPPSLWPELAGRREFAEAGLVDRDVWRPWAIAPAAAWNAFFSLTVPAVTLTLVCSLREEDREFLPGALLTLTTLAMLFGLLQFTGAPVHNPLVNESATDVGGGFANRNHLAVFLALGCLVVPAWVFASDRLQRWRAPAGVVLVLLFSMTILATGSRSGLALGLLAIFLAFALSWQRIRAELRRRPPWMFPALIAGMVGVVACGVFLSILADRAVSLDRIFEVDGARDMRMRGLPTVLEMIRQYFPWGAGFGSFDVIFRMHEPFELIKPTYFNHAHNDFLEIVLDGGIFSLFLLLAALGWWIWASIRAWRAISGAGAMLPRLGSSMLLVVMLASIVDYPARTPMIMAVVVVAAVWLSGHKRHVSAGSALPNSDLHL